MARDTSGDIHRLADLLMVGHGGALLLIFNARASGLEIGDLKGVAWWFAIGLIAAFAVAFLRFSHDATERAPLGLLETRHSRANSQSQLRGWIGYALIISALMFALGLLSGIAFLPGAQPAPTVSSSSAVPSSPAPSPRP